jgi:hypothetical protein
MAKKSIFRTLVRAESILNDQVRIVVPGWNPKSFLVPMSIFPDNLKALLFKGHFPCRFHAKANLAADEPLELGLHDFEF